VPSGAQCAEGCRGDVWTCGEWSCGSCWLHVRAGIRGMPRSLVERILVAAAIAEPRLQGHPEGVPSGPTSQTRQGIAVATASASSWESALALDIQVYIGRTLLRSSDRVEDCGWGAVRVTRMQRALVEVRRLGDEAHVHALGVAERRAEDIKEVQPMWPRLHTGPRELRQEAHRQEGVLVSARPLDEELPGARAARRAHLPQRGHAARALRGKRGNRRSPRSSRGRPQTGRPRTNPSRRGS
jgi:hypothetical protein